MKIRLRCLLKQHRHHRQKAPKTLSPPLTDREKLRESLKTLDRLNCEYEIVYNNIKYTRKLNEHESH